MKLIPFDLNFLEPPNFNSTSWNVPSKASSNQAMSIQYKILVLAKTYYYKSKWAIKFQYKPKVRHFCPKFSVRSKIYHYGSKQSIKIC